MSCHNVTLYDGENDQEFGGTVQYSLDNIVRVELVTDKRYEIAEGANLFDCLRKIRIRLEQDRILILCNGSRRDSAAKSATPGAP